MTRTLFLSLLSTLFLLGGTAPLRSISGTPWKPEGGKTYLAMYYNTNACHNCEEELMQYIIDVCGQDSTYRPLLIVMRTDMGYVRQQIKYLKQKYGNNIPIVCDDPAEKESLVNKKDIKEYPCLFILKDEEKPQYYSYHKLFSSRKWPKINIHPNNP